jgi:hypothetical protein
MGRSTPSRDPCVHDFEVQCSTCLTVSTDWLQVRVVATLRRIPSAARSPWFWPLVPLAAVAAVGQWVGVTAAIEVAAACTTAGFGVAVGLTIAGSHAGAAPDAKTPSDTNPPELPSSGGGSAGKEGTPATGDSTKTVDLRGARLINTMLVRADLRQADLRGATLTGADLSGADLTGARLGPLDDGPHAADPP